MAYQLQDLVCVKCRLVKADNASAFCACSGKYALTLAAPAFLDKVQTAYRLAEFHRLEHLRDTAAWLLRRNGLPLPELTLAPAPASGEDLVA